MVVVVVVAAMRNGARTKDGGVAQRVGGDYGNAGGSKTNGYFFRWAGACVGVG